MKKEKILLGIVMFIFLSLSVFGSSACYVDNPCYLYHDVLENETTHVTIELTNKWDSLLVRDNMTIFDNDTYQYVYAFAEDGDYNFTAFVYNASVLESSNYENVRIVAGGSSNTYFIMGVIILIFLIALSLVLQAPVIGLLSSIGLGLLGLSLFSEFRAISIVILLCGLLSALYFALKET